MRQNPHVRICGGPGSATTLVYPTTPRIVDLKIVLTSAVVCLDEGAHQLLRESAPG